MTIIEKSWPPLIVAEHPPKWVKSRDHLLTLLMWVLFAVMLETEFELFFGAHLERLGLGDFQTEANWPEFFERLTPYLLVALMLIMLLVIAGLRTFVRSRRSLRLPSPVSLGIIEEVRRAGIEEAELAITRTRRIVVVQINADGSYRFTSPASPPSRLQTGQLSV